jgi:hypothetical protein
LLVHYHRIIAPLFVLLPRMLLPGPCWGEGAVYRAVASLQRAFFDPPSDARALWSIEQELSRVSKLKAAPAIEYLGDLRHVRYRRHAR